MACNQGLGAPMAAHNVLVIFMSRQALTSNLIDAMASSSRRAHDSTCTEQRGAVAAGKQQHIALSHHNHRNQEPRPRNCLHHRFRLRHRSCLAVHTTSSQQDR